MVLAPKLIAIDDTELQVHVVPHTLYPEFPERTAGTQHYWIRAHSDYAKCGVPFGQSTTAHFYQVPTREFVYIFHARPQL